MRLLIIASLIVFVTTPLQAQNCTSGLPCGPVPWRLPPMPVLVSPTPFPTLYVTSVSGLPQTLTPTPTNTPVLNTTDWNIQIGTLQAIAEVTMEPITLEGNLNQEQIGDGATFFFAMTRALRDIQLGGFTPAFMMLFLIAGSVLATWLAGFLLPLVVAVIGIIRKVVQFILDFLPL